jgi:hypothetical protein
MDIERVPAKKKAGALSPFRVQILPFQGVSGTDTCPSSRHGRKYLLPKGLNEVSFCTRDGEGNRVSPRAVIEIDANA